MGARPSIVQGVRHSAEDGQTSAGLVTITPGTPTDHITVTIPNTGVKIFFRLKVVQ